MGIRHREGDKPAVEWTDGTKMWFKNGLRHREGDKPAVQHGKSDLVEYWWHGKLHREHDMPAVVGNGQQQWWYNGVFHREGGPAVVNAGDLQWWFQGKLHRPVEEGPAIVHSNQTVEFWVNGERVTDNHQIN